MAKSLSKVEVYLEIGKKRTFAGALEWPGWTRFGREEAAALQALFEAGIEFQPPAAVSDFTIVERLDGTSTTDFGAPDMTLSGDTEPVDEAELQRLQTFNFFERRRPEGIQEPARDVWRDLGLQ